jgi:hypothetical protein
MFQWFQSSLCGSPVGWPLPTQFILFLIFDLYFCSLILSRKSRQNYTHFHPPPTQFIQKKLDFSRQLWYSIEVRLSRLDGQK